MFFSTLSNTTHHAKIALPNLTTIAIAERTRPLAAVATAFAAIQRHMIVAPRDAARETGTNVGAQLFDGQHIIGRYIKHSR